jgi:hypothetical protein
LDDGLDMSFSQLQILGKARQLRLHRGSEAGGSTARHEI